MFCYKKVDKSDKLVSLQSCGSDIVKYDSDLVPISEAEFNKMTAEMTEKLAVTEDLIPTYDELLEENAALLYQVLTGEELADV